LIIWIRKYGIFHHQPTIISKAIDCRSDKGRKIVALVTEHQMDMFLQFLCGKYHHGKENT